MSVGGLQFPGDLQPSHSRSTGFREHLEFQRCQGCALREVSRSRRYRWKVEARRSRWRRYAVLLSRCGEPWLEPEEPQDGSRERVRRPHTVRDNALTFEFNL